jgi:serine/threonine-protein kinase
MIGKILGNYRMLKKIGEGGMGAVYLARDLSLEREVAIKVISPELARNPKLMTRFRVEAIAQAKLNHSHIVTIHSFDQEKNIYYIVMEYVQGKTLRETVKERGRFPVGQALHIFSQLVSAIAYAHSRGVVHRDIKPSNIFLAAGHTVKIGDFGIAKVEGIEGLTKTGTSLGSPLYSSPEQLLGQKTDARTDVYSLGMSLYEMLVGEPPLKLTGKPGYEAIQQTLDFVPQKPSTRASGIPPAVDDMVMKCIARERDARFRSAVELEAAVKAASATMKEKPAKAEKVKAPRQPSPFLMSLKEKFSQAPDKKYLGLAAALAIVLIAAAIILVTSSAGTPATQSGSVYKASEVNQPSGIKSAADMPPIVQEEPEPAKTVETPAKKTSTPVTGTKRQPDAAPASPHDVVSRMDQLTRRGDYGKALKLGKDSVDKGIATGDVYLEIARAYYYDGQKAQSAVYYNKALETDGSLSFNVEYEYDKNRYISGVLVITRQKLSFTPPGKVVSSSRYTFSLPLTQVDRVYTDFASGIKGLLKKKKNRKNPELVIKSRNNDKYTIQMKTGDKKLRNFIEHIIDTLRSA